jgi:NAD(P)H dehydrogenase (quinone)
MQGYFDRILGFNFAFTVDQNGARGLLKNEKALVINTAGSPEFVYDGWPDSKNLVSRPVTEGVLGYCGISNVKQMTFFGLPSSTDEQREKMLADVKTEIASL